MNITDEKQTPKRSLKRSLIVFIGNVLGIYLISILGLGAEVNQVDDIILLVLFISLINALLWPILTRIAMPFLVLTFGVGSLILNGLLLQFFGPAFDIEITGGAVIPDRVIVSSNSLVTKDMSNIPEGSVIGGIPAKLLKTGIYKIENVAFENVINDFFIKNPSALAYDFGTSVPKSICDYDSTDVV